MKKITLRLVLVLLLTSCEKNWTCDCNVDMGGNPGSVSYAIMDKTRSDAKAVCSATEDNFNRTNGTNASCDFK